VEDEKEVRWCIVKDKKYDFYCIGKANYGLPDFIKEDQKLEILFLDSKEGLEHLAKEGVSPKGLKTAIFSLF
jgi:hypothetical protein